MRVYYRQGIADARIPLRPGRAKATANSRAGARRSASPPRASQCRQFAQVTSTVGMPDRCADRIPSPLQGKGQTGQRAGCPRPARGPFETRLLTRLELSGAASESFRERRSGPECERGCHTRTPNDLFEPERVKQPGRIAKTPGKRPKTLDAENRGSRRRLLTGVE